MWKLARRILALLSGIEEAPKRVSRVSGYKSLDGVLEGSVGTACMDPLQLMEGHMAR